MGKAFQKLLEGLGGTPCAPLGLGDDDGDIADDFAVWVEALVAAIDDKALLQRSSASAEAHVKAAPPLYATKGFDQKQATVGPKLWRCSGKQGNAPDAGSAIPLEAVIIRDFLPRPNCFGRENADARLAAHDPLLGGTVGVAAVVDVARDATLQRCIQQQTSAPQPACWCG